MFSLIIFGVIVYFILQIYLVFDKQNKKNNKAGNSCSKSQYISKRPVSNDDFLPNYTVMDLETTGFNYRHDRIIQFAAVRVREHKPVESLSFVVNPGIPIPPEASKINGFTDEKVANNEPFVKHIREVLSFLGNDVLVGHNLVNFDRRFLEYEFGEALMNQCLDTLLLAQKYIHSTSNCKLTTLYRELVKKEPDNAHDALADCYMTYQVFQEILLTMGRNGKKATRSIYYKSLSWYSYELPKRDFIINKDADPALPFYKQNVVISGRIPGMTIKEALQAICNQGGDFSHQIRQKTTIFVKGVGVNENMFNHVKSIDSPNRSIRIINAEEFKQLCVSV